VRAIDTGQVNALTVTLNPLISFSSICMPMSSKPGTIRIVS
jgi:hypothetical protein